MFKVMHYFDFGEQVEVLYQFSNHTAAFLMAIQLGGAFSSEEGYYVEYPGKEEELAFQFV